MKQQLEIIREALEDHMNVRTADALVAMSELEDMLSGQEPVAEITRINAARRVVGIGNWHRLEHGTKLYAAPAAQQAEAVPSSDLNPDEGDPVTLWAEIWRLREAVKGPDGYATWQDAATAERIRRVRAESKQAEEAKAVPTHDDTDLIKQMLEALRSCSGVSHWPALIPTINAARKRLETPQQAEAVPPGYVADKSFRWDGEKQQHIPRLIIEFEPVPANSPCDAQGWKDRDTVAKMFAAQGAKT